MISLERITEEGIKAIRQASKKLGNSEEKLDCTSISSLTKKELKALFRHLPKEWRSPQGQELYKFIDLNTLNGDLKRCIIAYLTTSSEPPLTHSSRNFAASFIKKTKLSYLFFSIVALGGISFLSFRTIQYFSQPKLRARSLVIGTLWTQQSQEKLAEHLEKNSYSEELLGFYAWSESITGDYKCRGIAHCFVSIVLDK